MKKSQLVTMLVITTLLASIFSAYSLDNTASAEITSPSVDTTPSSHQWQKSSNPSPLTITTSTTQEIIYASLYVQTSGRGLSISSSPSLTWHYRGGGNTSSSNGEIASWWAVSDTAQTITITFTSSSGSNGGSVTSAFCVKNAYVLSPFDPNLSSASFNYGASASASASITTANSNNLVIGIVGLATNKGITAGSGYTEIDNTGLTSPSGANEWMATSTAGTYEPSFTIGSSSSAWVVIADAFTMNTLTVLPEYGLGGATAFVVCFAAMLVFFKPKKAA